MDDGYFGYLIIERGKKYKKTDDFTSISLSIVIKQEYHCQIKNQFNLNNDYD